MRNFITNNKNFIDYCQKMGVAYDKIMALPKCYTKDMIKFQILNEEKGKMGLMDNTPAKVILTIRKDGNELVFEPSEDIKKYVGV